MQRYKCPICKLEYTTAELAKRCEQWCATHDSCNLGIGRLAVNRATLAATAELPTTEEARRGGTGIAGRASR